MLDFGFLELGVGVSDGGGWEVAFAVVAGQENKLSRHSMGSAP